MHRQHIIVLGDVTIIMAAASGRFWSPKKRAVAVTLRQEGYTYQQVAERIGAGATKAGIYKLCKKFERQGQVIDMKRVGRKKITSQHDDRVMVRAIMTNRRKSSKDIADDLNEAGVRVSSRTVRRRLWQAGLKAKTPRKKPFLNMVQRRKRVEWAKQHIGWTAEQWKKVIFSDESRISIFGQDGLQYVRRRTGEAHRPECCTPSMKHPVSVMLWGCMARDGMGRLQIMDGNVTARKYIDTVLEKKLMSSAKDIFKVENPEFIFQQDGAPCHTAKICKDWFERHGVTVLDWPGNSPDLNPIENLWARLKHLVSARRPSNRASLITAIIECWFHVISHDQLVALVDSTPRRCQAVIAARGYPTKY
jgi:transposase